MKRSPHVCIVVFILPFLAGAVLGSCRKRKPRGEPQTHPHPRPVKLTPPPARAEPPAAPGPGFSFFVSADTHFGFEGIEPWNKRQVEAMNRLPGTALPASIGGRVERPLGVLVAGDLTDRGKPEQWRTFVKYFGRTGRDGMLRYPVYLATGNHDRKGSRNFVLKKVRARHGALVYSWDWHGVHFVCLDHYPGRRKLRWLKKDLSALRPRTPVVIFFHYSILGPFSQWWGKKAKQRFRKAILHHNVIAIFHGHYHGAGRYRWAGFDVYNVGSPLYYFVSFAVARITAHHLSVASWNYEHGRWSWAHLKRLRNGPDPKLLPAK